MTDVYLNSYRSKASFKEEDMKLAIENRQRLLLKNKVWQYLSSDPIFHPLAESLSPHEEKSLTAKQLEKFLFSGLFDNIDQLGYAARTKYLMVINEATEMLNPNLSIKFALGISLFANALSSLGTERHMKYYNDVWNGKILSCLAITELEHGSDTKRLKTTATYDHNKKEFVLNSPDIGAAKCWVGNLGMQCTHALLFAQLIVNGVCHGLHGFIVPVRDPKTNIAYKNIIVGDIGEKAGLNGIDNGYIMFKSYRIPQENLLNRIGDINEEGVYESSFTDPRRLLGAALESLSAGRVAILQESCNTLIKAVVIAVRYAAQRVQFSDSKGVEMPIIEYQTHQWRLFPYVAACIAIKCFVQDFSDLYIDCVANSRDGNMDVKQVSQMVSGVHALVCCSKALVTWTSRDAIQECREACGGHGYHKAAGFGDLRNNHDPRVTFEGDNTVLLQQTSNWLLRLFSDKEADFSVFPLSILAFITKCNSVLAVKFIESTVDDVASTSFIIKTYEWLICWLSYTTNEKMGKLQSTLKDRFKVRNLSQVFKSRSLALVFAEYNIIIQFKTKFKKCESELRLVLEKLCILFGLWSLYKHLPLLYQGEYSKDGKLAELISEGILLVCQQLKPEIVLLIDSISPPDFILNSVLGSSNGKVYENIMKAFRGHNTTAYDFNKAISASKL